MSRLTGSSRRPSATRGTPARCAAPGPTSSSRRSTGASCSSSPARRGARRGRPHRSAPPAPRAPGPRPSGRGLLRRPRRRGATSSTTSTASPATAAWCTATIAGTERDYLLLEYRGGDRLYVPSDQIDTITPYTGGEHPTLNRLNGSEWQRQRARVRQAVREVAQELVVLYQRRLASPGHAFSPDTPWQAELEQSFPYPETADQLRAIDEVKADMERAVADGPPRLRRRRLRQDRGRGPRGVQGGPGRQAGRGARADDAPRPAALPDLRRPLRALSRCGSRCSRDSSPRPRPRRVVARPRRRLGRRRRRHPPPAGRRRTLQATSACWSSTRSSASASATKRR